MRVGAHLDDSQFGMNAAILWQNSNVVFFKDSFFCAKSYSRRSRQQEI